MLLISQGDGDLGLFTLPSLSLKICILTLFHLNHFILEFWNIFNLHLKRIVKKKQWKFPVLKKFDWSNNCFTGKKKWKGTADVLDVSLWNFPLFPIITCRHAYIPDSVWLQLPDWNLKLFSVTKWHLPLAWAVRSCSLGTACCRATGKALCKCLHLEIIYLSHDSKWFWFWL